MKKLILTAIISFSAFFSIPCSATPMPWQGPSLPQMTQLSNDLIRYNNFYNQNPQKNTHCVNIHIPGLANSSIELSSSNVQQLLAPTLTHKKNLCLAWHKFLKRDINNLESIKQVLTSAYAFVILNYSSPNLSLINPHYDYPSIGGSIPSQNLAWIFTPKNSFTQVFLSK